MGLVQCHRMATGCGNGCGFQTGRAATNHHDIALNFCRGQGGEFQLATRFGVLNARYRIAVQHMANAGLIAGDTRADIIQIPGLCLGGHQRIGDHRAGHSTHISLTRGQNHISNLRLVDTPGHKDRQ